MAFSFIINGTAQNINFTSFSVTQIVNALADYFEMSVGHEMLVQSNSPPAPPATTLNKDIAIGDTIKIYWANDLLLTGYIEQQSMSLDGQSRNIIFAGRSKAGDIVDSTFTKSFEWVEGSALSDIIHDMLKDFDIAFHPDNSQTFHSTRKLNVDAGDNLYQRLESFGSAFGVFFSSMPDGNITAFKPETDRLPEFTARLGMNILSLHYARDETVKYSPLIVAPEGGLFANIEPAIVKDTTLKRYRPFYEQPNNDGITPATRANFMARSNQRKAMQISLAVPEIVPLPPATIIHIDASEIGIKGDYAISTQKLVADDKGAHTEFECVHADALLDLHEPFAVKESLF